MTIVQINMLGSTLSTGRTTRQMHDYFCEHNIESYIVCPMKIDCDDAFNFISKYEMKLNTLETICTGLEGYHSIIPTRRLIRYLEKVKPDIVHLRVLHGLGINMPMLFEYLAKHNIGTVITLHDLWYITGKCCYYTQLGCNKWMSGCNHCPDIRHGSRPYLLDQSKKMWMDKQKYINAIPNVAIIGVSDWVKDQAERSILRKSKIVKRIYNWIDLKKFSPKDTKCIRKELGLESKFVILGVSASWMMNDRKGLSHYIELAKIMPNDYQIVLVGKMEYTGKLPPNVLSVSTVNSQDRLAELYSMADVYLNLSMEETFGKVSAEALSCGTPVIAIDSTANKELVPEGGGVVLSSLDADSMLKAIAVVKNANKEEVRHICRSFAEANFDMEQNIKEYISVYESFCGKTCE